MDKFWEWMDGNNYGCFRDIEIIKGDKSKCFQVNGQTISFYPQMLIGYMIEYCFDNEIVFKVDDYNVYEILENAIMNDIE